VGRRKATRRSEAHHLISRLYTLHSARDKNQRGQGFLYLVLPRTNGGKKGQRGWWAERRIEKVVGRERRRDTHDPISKLYTSIEFGNRNKFARAFRIWSCVRIAKPLKTAGEGEWRSTVFKEGVGRARPLETA
jgi:hypothetical protein